MALSKQAREWWNRRSFFWREEAVSGRLLSDLADPLIAVADHLAACESLLADIRAHIAKDDDDAWGGTEQMTSRQWETLAKRIAALLA